MRANYVSLLDLIKLLDNERLSEKYVRYLAGFSEHKQYRHTEVETISHLVSYASLGTKECATFLYGYEIPQLNKEFDLLKIFNELVLNIELKSQRKTDEAMIAQLKQNAHYLRILGKRIESYVFVDGNEPALYHLNDDVLEEVGQTGLLFLTSLEDANAPDLDDEFAPSRILVSPLNDTDRFVNGDYLLTENQNAIEKRILSKIDKNEDEPFFYSITGNPGTGKTLLLYDIAKSLSEKDSVLVIHAGQLCAGHIRLNELLSNVRIIQAKDLRYREIKTSGYLLVDEAHRLYESAVDQVIRWAEKSKTICVFSFDENQRLSHAENRRNTIQKIIEVCGENTSKLTNKIRTNKEISFFITCLFDTSKYDQAHAFPNVKLIYEPNRKTAIEIAKQYPGYQYISYTPSTLFHSIDDQESELNTHRVIGQEFDRVVMILDGNFHYEGCKLIGGPHPNPDYIFVKLLYQGLTRARKGIALVITEPALLDKLLAFFPSGNE